MIRELAKIANKLDGLGLTKEADVLDLYLAKMAADVISPTENARFTKAVTDFALSNKYNHQMKSDGSLILSPGTSQEDIATFVANVKAFAGNTGIIASSISNGTLALYPSSAAKKTAPKTWDEYTNATGNQQVRNAWIALRRENNEDESFQAFVSWWKSMKTSGLWSEGGSPSEVVKMLLSDRRTMNLEHSPDDDKSADTYTSSHDGKTQIPVRDGGAMASTGPMPTGVSHGGGDYSELTPAQFKEAPWMKSEYNPKLKGVLNR